MTMIVSTSRVKVKPSPDFQQRIRAEEKREKRERQAERNIELAKQWLSSLDEATPEKRK